MELDSLLAMGAPKKDESQEVTTVQTNGAPVAPEKTVFAWKPGAAPAIVKHEARLVMCGNFFHKARILRLRASKSLL